MTASATPPIPINSSNPKPLALGGDELGALKPKWCRRLGADIFKYNLEVMWLFVLFLMLMSKPFKNLLDKMPKERRERIEDRAQEILIGMALQELRQTRHLTQQQLADALNLNQAALSKMENQADMHISTLRRILSAMGGELKIIAQFPEGEVVINQFEQK